MSSNKRPTDHLQPSAKKRTQDRQGARDEEEEDSEPEDPGQFAKASEDVLKTRRIIKARRGGGGFASTEASKPADANEAGAGRAAAPAPPSSNPFAGVSLFGAPPKPADPAPAQPKASATPAAPAQAELGSTDAVAAGSDTKDEAATSPAPGAAAAPAEDTGDGSTATGLAAGEAEAAAGKQESPAQAAADKPAEQANASSAPSAEGSTGTADKPAENGGGASSGFKGGFSFGSGLAKSVGGGFGSLAGSASGSGGFGAFASQLATAGGSESAGGLFGSKPAFAFGSSAGAGASTPAQSVFGGSSAGAAQEAPAAKPMLAAEGDKVETGEEGERTVFSGDGTLFSFGSAGGWKERGRGELRVKVGQSGRARLVMRQRGNLRLLLNANLWEDMAVNVMDGGLGVTFAVHNAAAAPAADGKEGSAEAAGTPPKEAQGGSKLELTTFAFRVKVKQTLEEFKTAIEGHKKADAAAANV